MESSKKILLTTIGIAILIVLVTGVTFAFFNYTRTGVNNTIKVGRISFVTRQTSTINLVNVFPIDSEDIDTDTDNVDEVVIEIEGDTDYTDGIEYLVSSVDSNIYTSSGLLVPISLDITVNGLGTENANYWIARESKNANIYKRIVGGTLVDDQMLLVGYIKKNTTNGQAEGVDGSITIKAYLDKDKILISDTYDGTESETNGTTNSMAQGKTVITTSEWNSLQSSGLSFKVKVEVNEGIWVKGSLEEIMRKSAVMDNTTSTYVTDSAGINFGKISGDTDNDGVIDNGKGVYMRAGTENDSYPILYYRGAVEDNNVVFANKCWKAVRTTDTGGVKLIYNGLLSEVYEEVPLAEASYTKNIANTDSRWTFDSSDSTWNIEITDNSQPAIEFTVPAGDNYTMVMTGTSGSSCGGTYTFYKNGTSVQNHGNGGGASMDLTYAYGSLLATDVIKMNYTGSSSDTCAITFKLKMLVQGEKITDNGCDNKGTASQITLNISGTDTNTFAFSGTNLYKSPAYNGYMYGTVYEYSNNNWTSGAKFGSSFTWDGTNYTLADATVTTPNTTHHYSCNSSNAEATCTDLRYVYYWSGSSTLNSNTYYITLQNGKSVEDALREMQTNTTNSNAKDKIETWYASNLTSYTSKIEDTIYCNDRSMNTLGDNQSYIDNGWNANGGNLRNYYLYYSSYGRAFRVNSPSLSCENKNDAFTWKNGDGNQKLQYPVGMITSDEVILAGGQGQSNGTYYLNSGNYYWSLSPYCFHFSYAYGFDVYSDGYSDGRLSSYNLIYSIGLRPVISLKPGTPVISGDGTVADPYVIE